MYTFYLKLHPYSSDVHEQLKITICFLVQNKNVLKKTPYEWGEGRQNNISHSLTIQRRF